MDVLDELRAACAVVAQRARHVRINQSALSGYAALLDLSQPPVGPHADEHLISASRETLAAFWLTLDAINFGSGWFPTLRKREGRSGYHTIALGLKERFSTHGAWSAEELTRIDAQAIARTLHQDPDHALMELFARSLQDLGAHLLLNHGGRVTHLVDSAQDRAPALVAHLATWECFADTSTYDSITVPFLKRAQIAAADLARAGVAPLAQLDRLTMFADNLVPHVLRLDEILIYKEALIQRIERGDLLLHGSPEEVEIRACSLHAVELIATHRDNCPADIDQMLWLRGQEPRYKAVPRHRSRCTAY